MSLTELLAQTFVQHALLAALLVSVACGVIGALVVVNRLVFMAGGIAHSAYGGVGLAFYAGLPVLPTTGTYSAVPFDGWVQAIWYRTDLFDEDGLEAPLSWDAINAALDKLFTEND